MATALGPTHRNPDSGVETKVTTNDKTSGFKRAAKGRSRLAAVLLGAVVCVAGPLTGEASAQSCSPAVAGAISGLVFLRFSYRPVPMPIIVSSGAAGGRWVMAGSSVLEVNWGRGRDARSFHMTDHITTLA